MSLVAGTCGVSIDGAEPVPCDLSVERDDVDVSVAGPIPDERWSYVDAAGHFHAYDQGGEMAKDRYPTLRPMTRHHSCELDHDHANPWVDADDEFTEECDGWNEYYHVCRICGEEVKPGTVPGPHYRTMPGMWSWSLEARGCFDQGKDVSVRVVGPEAWGKEWFGVAKMLGPAGESGPDDPPRWRLLGVGPLGSRKVAK